MGKLKIIFVLILLFVTACQPPPQKTSKAKPEVLVQTAKASQKNLNGWIETSGKLVPVATIDIRPRIKGMIQEIYVKEGNTVDTDTPLVQIDSRTYQFRKDELQNQLTSEKAKLNYLVQKQNRLSKISDPNYIPQADREALDLEVEQMKALVANTELKLRTAQLDCDFCIVRSPIAGRIGKISAQVGQWVTESDKPLMTIDKIDLLNVEFCLSEDELLKLETRPIPFTIYSMVQPQNFCSATCTFIDHQMDAKTGTIKMEGIVSNTNKKFRKNQVVKVLIEGKKYNDVITVPRQAVKMNESGFYVYKISANDEAQIHPVIIEDELEDAAIIQSGLEVGDEVVTEGHLKLYPGAKIVRKNQPNP